MSSRRSCRRPAIVLALGLLAPLAAPGPARPAAIAVGTNGISMTSNSVGATWNPPHVIDPNVSVASVWMTSESSGIAVGNGNSIFRTSNLGVTWTPVTSPITTTYNDVMFPSPTVGYIAATNGQVLKTTNGGTSWTVQSTNSPGGLSAIHFVSETQGCAVGEGGAIVRTTNGGTSWINESTGSAALHAVFFFDASNGWAAGVGGTILRTTNGGDTWSAVTSGTSSDLQGIWFTSATNGFVCGGDRDLRRTTNGGTTWTNVTLPTTQQQSGLFGMMFAGPDTGIVVGSGVNAYKTVNGGTTWTVANPDPTSEVLRAVHLTRPPGPPPQVTVNVSAQPAGRSFRVDGTTYTTPQVFTWDAGSTHVLDVVSPQSVNAGERYSFTSWSGSASSTASQFFVSPTANATYTANFQRQFLLTMPTVNGGTTTPGTGWHASGANVQIRAFDGTGYDFASWTGSGSGSYTGTSNPVTISMNGAITQTASFVAGPITLTFLSNPSGRTVLVDGTTRTTPYTLQTTADVAHTLGVASPQGEANGTRLAFLSWSDGGAQSHTIDPLVSTTYTATFKTQHQLTVAASPGAGGSVSPGTGWHDAGATVTLTPTASPGYTYYLMTGTGSGSFTGLSDDPPVVTMNGPIGETAYFSNAVMRTVTLESSPPGPGLFVGTLAVGSSKRFVWPNATALTISAPSIETATENVKRWNWTRWSDFGLRTHTVSPTSSTKYTAYFDVEFGLTMAAEQGGTTTPPVGVSWYDSAATAVITAFPGPDHVFASWGGNGYNGLLNPAQFPMNGARSQLARFNFKPIVTLDDAIAGRKFVAGEPETIRWSSNHVSTSLYVLEYKHVVSSTWLPIGSATPETGMLAWTPPDTPQSNLMMRLRHPVLTTPADTVQTFSICDPYFNAGAALTGLGAGVRATGAAAGDLNGDGVPDLVLALTNALLQVRLGTAGGTPGVGAGPYGSTIHTALGGLIPSRVHLGDLDRDGSLDAVALTGGTQLIRLKGAGNGSLLSATAIPGTGPYADFALADVSEDGLLDVVAVRPGPPAALCVSRAGGANGVFSGTYTVLPDVPTLEGVERIEVADVNRDGIVDVVALAGAPPRIAVHFGLQGPQAGSGQFGPARTFDLPGRPVDLVVADFDGNGRLDALVVDGASAPQVSYADLGASGMSGLFFVRRDTVTTETGYRSAQGGDFDRDGAVDVALRRGSSPVARLFRGDGDGGFSFLTAQAAGAAELSAMLVHDFVEDGRADLLLATESGDLALRVADFLSCGGSAGGVFLDAPNEAGLVFPIGSEMSIAWRRFQSSETVDLDVSRDGGVTWEPIARTVAHSPVSWTVTPPATESGFVRARPSNGSHLFDASNKKFLITNPTVGVDPPATLVTAPEFAAPWPNPSRGAVRLELALPAPGLVRLDVFDVAGRRVRTVLAGERDAGRHVVSWDGADDAGRRLAAGIYFARASWPGFRAERRLVRLD